MLMRSYLGCTAIGLISVGLLIVMLMLGRSSNDILENLYVEGGSQSYMGPNAAVRANYLVPSQAPPARLMLGSMF